jgi:DNA-binding LacI/PurR family transcriptional regulator
MEPARRAYLKEREEAEKRRRCSVEPEQTVNVIRIERHFPTGTKRLGLSPLRYTNNFTGTKHRADQMGAESMRRLLKRNRLPDGVFAYNDPLVIGAMDAILESGLSIPEDIAVIGCGKLHYDPLLRVPLSTVDQNSQAIGERTAKVLLRLLESKARPENVSVILEPSLVIRASTGRCS